MATQTWTGDVSTKTRRDSAASIRCNGQPNPRSNPLIARGRRIRRAKAVHHPSKPPHALEASHTLPLSKVCHCRIASRTPAGLRLGDGWLLSRRYQLHSAPEAEVAPTYSLVRYVAALCLRSACAVPARLAGLLQLLY